MPTPIEHLLAMLDQLTPSQLDALPPARLLRLSDALYAAHVLAEMTAGGQPYPPVVRAVPRPQPKCGVLADLGNGGRSE